MSMSVREANAVNELLDFILGLESVYGESPMDSEARAAAALLAKSAYKRLSAGLDSEQVIRLWNKRKPARGGRS
jgi:hypothetical protein